MGGESGTGDRGLAADGTIRREGSAERVQTAFAPVVDAARARITGAFGPGRLHSAYLYGSVPRGTAIPGVSDLDLLVVVRDGPTGADRVAAEETGTALDRAFAVIDGAGLLLSSVRAVLSEAERDDFGFFVACLCAPLLGEDLAPRLPRYRPTSQLARGTNGDLALALPRWRALAAGATTDEARLRLSRRVSRRLVRTAFTLVMPRWGGWTSDLHRSAELFARHYPDHPERIAQVRAAAATARTPSPDPAVLTMLVEDLGPWLVAEYTGVHGTKALRPEE
ncbi:MAG TPA: nucleotidyltransferase domain-containing protein [Streptomyces sp.]|uniref:nucleotidyltransferase domain-containing protein n=1 Tax=Streptomyces sp. TaxID=1931 RepID=UPI002C29F477|nr:nucleotidyltransferase domain-containing protein [Streptomyces sp.]HWU06999.1 nucleotidyltransferase domain-containing protein [Streptomyces sp.]